MNNLANNYMKSVKYFFPLMGKKEKEYLKSLEITINDFCETNSMCSIEDIYNDFGHPSEVANSYFSTIDTAYLIKRIGLSKNIKTIMIIVVLIALVGLAVYGLYLNHAYNLIQEQIIFFEKTIMY